MPTQPNVLFLVVDSIRYDTARESDFPTPNIDRLADNGVEFTNCFAQGVSTAPSMTAMLTGRYPLDYGGHWYLEEEQPTMAEQFQRNGYTTGAIHSNPNVSRLRNFHRGFDTFEENILPFEADGIVERAPDDLLRYANKFARVLRRTPYMPIETVNEHLRNWISEKSEPWFLWTQYMDVHGPYLPGDDFTYRNKFRAERLWRKAAVNTPEQVTDEEHEELWENYRKEVRYLDRELGSFLDELDSRGQLDDTVVILVGDHGDEFTEHGRYGHGNLPYDELTHVPLIVQFPESADIEQPATVDTLVRTIDILPTMLDIADAELAPEMKERIEGESLLPVLEGDDPSYDMVVTEKEMRGEDHLRFGFRTAETKYLYDGKEDEHYLYDLTTDPAEQQNLADSESLDQFTTALDDRLRKIESTSAGVEIPDFDDHQGVEERLSALGYK
ncbi:sulfatase [Haloarchaeobius baliensis]|uniref:sulfatase n=1 Tax=Haloarchaeobius baliensis TaxID=1670458 RepID=UPI003F8822A6